MTAFKQRFQRKFEKYETKSVKYSLKNIRDQSPKVYSADEVMKQHPSKRCDSFVLCLCAPSTTGIYAVEEKGNRPPIKIVQKQLQGGANFICNLLEESDQFEFLPVLVAKGTSFSMRNELNKASVKLRQDDRKIEHINPGDSLRRIGNKSRQMK